VSPYLFVNFEGVLEDEYVTYQESKILCSCKFDDINSRRKQSLKEMNDPRLTKDMSKADFHIMRAQNFYARDQDEDIDDCFWSKEHEMIYQEIYLKLGHQVILESNQC
jgi:hypothetical protein